MDGIPVTQQGAEAAVIGLLGDPHAEDDLLEQALVLLARHEPDVVVCTGDVVDGRGDLRRTVGLLRDHDVLTVRGNHDRWLLEQQVRDLPDVHHLGDLDAGSLAWLRDLPATRRVPTVAGSLLLCHGVGDDDMNRLRCDDYGYALEQNASLADVLAASPAVAVMVKGHTHHAGLARLGLGRAPYGGYPAPHVGGPLLVVDAGTLRRDHEPVCGVLELGSGQLIRYRLPSGAHEVVPLPHG